MKQHQKTNRIFGIPTCFTAVGTVNVTFVMWFSLHKTSQLCFIEIACAAPFPFRSWFRISQVSLLIYFSDNNCQTTKTYSLPGRYKTQRIIWQLGVPTLNITNRNLLWESSRLSRSGKYTLYNQNLESKNECFQNDFEPDEARGRNETPHNNVDSILVTSTARTTFAPFTRKLQEVTVSNN